MRLVIFIISLLAGATCIAQHGRQVSISLMPYYNSEPLELERYYPLHSSDSIMFETFRCYISGVQLYNKGKTVFAERDSYHLLDAAQPESMLFSLSVPGSTVYDSMSCYLGIDSMTNVSGAMGGALDPSLGMYWAWQSGYINLKIEGVSNLCSTRHNRFRFHIGGYLPPHNPLQEIGVKASGDNVTIKFPLDRFLEQVDISRQNEIMHPCAEAVILAQQLAHLIKSQEE